MKNVCPLCKKETCHCDQLQNKKYDITTITAEELLKKITSSPNIKVINVLNKEYYDDCHIQGSISIPLDQIESSTQNWNKDSTIIAYCANYLCTASTAAWKTLHDMSFKNVYTYEGGIKEWKDKNLPVEGTCSLPYLQKNSTTNPHKKFYLKAFIASVIGSIFVAICCFTPILAILLGAIGLGMLIKWLDSILIPLLISLLALSLFFFWKWKTAK